MVIGKAPNIMGVSQQDQGHDHHHITQDTSVMHRVCQSDLSSYFRKFTLYQCVHAKCINIEILFGKHSIQSTSSENLMTL